MRLSKEQKKILKSIPNKKIRLEQKLQFKIQNKKENQPLNLEPLYAVDLGNGATLFRRKCKLAEQPENHNSTIKKGVFYKGKIFDTMEEALEYAPMSETTLERIKEVHKNWMGLANMDFNIKGNEIISDEKAKEIVLNNEYLQKVLDETHDVNFFRDLQRICVKCQNYEYANKFRQKVLDILYTLSTVKLIELVQDGTIELNDMSRAISRQKVESANNNPKQFTLEDMRKIYVNGILDNQNLLVTPETCQITFDMHLRNVEKKQ